MKSELRKNATLPVHAQAEGFEQIFREIREHPEKPQSRRVEECLDLLSSLRDDWRNPENVRIVTRLRNVLGAYQWVVKVMPTPEGFRAVYEIANRDGLSRDDIWERRAVGDLLNLVRYLEKRPIRRCSECKGWFFAPGGAERPKWCGGNCRQHHYDNDPGRRAEKVRYMRDHRAEEKRLKLRDDERRREESNRRGVGLATTRRRATK